MGAAISLRVQSLRTKPARSWNRLRRLALLTPSCSGPAPTAKRSEDPRDRHIRQEEQEQLDLNGPNQRGLLGRSGSAADRDPASSPDLQARKGTDDRFGCGQK